MELATAGNGLRSDRPTNCLPRRTRRVPQVAITGDVPSSDDAQQVHLHLGAHKTATTHLQQIFLANRGFVAKEGVHYDGPVHLRSKKWLTAFRGFAGSAPRNMKRPEYTRLRAKQPLAPLWLISEENLIGGPGDLIRKPGLYPLVGKRLRSFRRLFPATEVKIFFALRSYDTFLRSCYCEIVRNNEYFSWDHFYYAVSAPNPHGHP